MTGVDKTIIPLSDLLLLRDLLNKTGLRPAYLVLPVFLALGTGIFEAIGVALLVPLAKGLMGMDFGFLKDDRVVKFFLPLAPPGLFISNSTLFIGLVSLIFTSFVIKNVLTYGSTVGVASLVRKFASEMRKLLFSRCLAFGKLYFDRTSAGYLQGVLINITDRTAARLSDLHQLFTGFFTLAAYLVVMLCISMKLTLIVLLLFPILNHLSTWVIRKVRTTSASYVDAHSDMNKRIFNAMSCMLLVKSYNMEHQEQRRLAEVSDRVADLEFSMDKKILMVIPLQEIIMLGVILILISIMALIVTKQGGQRLPSFLVFFYIIRRAATSFSIISHLKTTLASISGPLTQLHGILSDDDKHFIAGGKAEFPGLKSRIEFVDVDYSYADETNVLKGVSFSVQKGKMTAIVGPSGAGKTTIISLLTRFYDCPAGAILMDGEDIRSFDLKSLRDSMSLVSQDTMLLNDTLGSNITYGLNGQATPERLEEAVRKARLADFIAKLPEGLETFIGDRGVQLSGGEKQRVSIARSLLKGAEILILDEATSSLDTMTERLIQEAIDEMIGGKTAIVIAHRLSTIRKADKIVVIEDGKVVEDGTLTELLANRGRFHQYWEAQKFF